MSAEPGSYPAPPAPRSAYPSAADGGFGIELDLTPDDGAAPGPGYDDGVQRPPVGAVAALNGWRGRFIGLTAALVLAALTLGALVVQPIGMTVVVVLAVATAGVLAATRADQVRRTVLIAAAGPALMLAYYWTSAMIRFTLG